MLTTTVSTDLTSLRGSDTNTLLRLYDQTKRSGSAAQSRELSRQAERIYTRVVRELRKRGLRA
jgi:hypothetical protein